ncbi:MarR family winged helix-turn-helix transcriptional regulator [Candidatus Izemoplasma sp. B36]|uniref:MarR family winged helix-turn-helix transcriptional regulator n=1 Tax=Candidatus Izemoplasma sp. B36 TaxID=3242468 RepID=UPI003556C131
MKKEDKLRESKAIVNELLVDIFNRILAIEGEDLKNKGIKLSMSEVHVLEAVEKVEQPTMTNIANKLGITVGSLTVSVNTLYQKGYVSRERDPDDRRKVVVGLLPKAEEVLEKHNDFHNEMIDSIFKDLKLEEDELLISSLKKLSSYFINSF